MARVSSDPRVRSRRAPDRLTLVVKPTTRCNAACVYCSAHKDAHGPSMTLDCVRQLYERLARDAERGGKADVVLLWHGGEPLMMGKDFYLAAWQMAAEYDPPRFRHQIQTNLLLLDEEWAELLREHEVPVGTSVDPFSDQRVFRDGRLQLPVWIEKFDLAARAGLRIGIVFTVTPAHLGLAERLYHYMRDLQDRASLPVGIRINPMYPAGSASKFDPAQQLQPQDYGRFLMEVDRLWERDGRPFPISPLQEWFGGAPPSCDFVESCVDRILGVDGTGGVYKCGRYMDAGGCDGKIETDGMDDVIASPRMKAIAQRSRVLRAGPCRDCAYWTSCYGGCPYMAELVYGSVMRKSPFCADYLTCFRSKPEQSRRESCGSAI